MFLYTWQNKNRSILWTQLDQPIIVYYVFIFLFSLSCKPNTTHGPPTHLYITLLYSYIYLYTYIFISYLNSYLLYPLFYFFFLRRATRLASSPLFFFPPHYWPLLIYLIITDHTTIYDWHTYKLLTRYARQMGGQGLAYGLKTNSSYFITSFVHKTLI